MGLWGGALFGRRTRWQWRGAFLLGTAPDILAFGPFFLSRVGSADFRAFPPYVYRATTSRTASWCGLSWQATVWLDPQKVPMDSGFLGPSHPVRHSPARTLILPDALALASSNTSGQWPALGSTQGHDSELRRSHRCVRTHGWVCDIGVSEQNFAHKTIGTVDPIR